VWKEVQEVRQQDKAREKLLLRVIKKEKAKGSSYAEVMAEQGDLNLSLALHRALEERVHKVETTCEECLVSSMRTCQIIFCKNDFVAVLTDF
jgi:hypothetical protein